MLRDCMRKKETRIKKYAASLVVSTTLVLIITGMVTQGTIGSSFLVNVLAQENNSDMTSSGMGGMMEHGGQGQGMSGMGGMMERSTSGAINEICHMGDDMPPHYCEPSYHVMSSVRGVRITDVEIANDTSVVLTLNELNPMSNNTVGDVVIVGGGGDLAGAALLEGNWKGNTTATINFIGTGSVYSADRFMIHLFPFNG